MALTLTLREPPTVPLETEGLTPDRLMGRRRGEIEALTVWHGNRRARLGDFFTVSGDGDGDGELRVEGDRAAGRAPAQDGGTSPETLALWAIGTTSGLFGAVEEPPSWVLEDLGDARWAAELVGERLTELRVRMRSIGRAVD